MEFPKTVHSWTIKKEGNFLIVTTTSKANGANNSRWKFPLKKGSLYFYNGTGNAYVYFRERAFEQALEMLGVDRVEKFEGDMEVAFKSYTEGWGRFKKNLLATDGYIETHVPTWRYDIPDKKKIQTASYVLYENKDKNAERLRDRRERVLCLNGRNAVEVINLILAEKPDLRQKEEEK